MGHHGHAQLHDRTVSAFVANLSGTAIEQTGNVAFDHRAAVTASTGQLHLIRRPFAVEIGVIEDRKNLLRSELGRDRLNGLGDTDRENAPLME